MAALLASCSKEGSIEINFVTLKVAMENNAKTFMYDDTPFWHTGDPFYVNANTQGEASNVDGGNCDIANIPEAAHYTVIYPKSIVSGTPDITTAADVSVNIPYHYDYTVDEQGNQKVPMPMCGKSNENSTTIQFKNVGGLLKVVVSNLAQGETLDSIVVQHSHVSLSGASVITNAQSAEPTLCCSGSKAVALYFSNNTNCGNGEYYLPVPPIASHSGYAFTINIYTKTRTLIPTEGTVCRYKRTQNAGNGYIGRSQMATVPFAVADEFKTPFDFFYFCVSNNYDKIQFSPGIVEQCYNGDLRFSGSQYSYRGSNQINTIGFSLVGDYIPESAWRDYLPWGTVSFNRFNPYDNGSTFNDWGNTDYFNRQYRTLSREEWSHLIARTRKAGATVNGVNGIVLLPNNWIGCPTGCSFVDGFEDGYSTNTYDLTQWADMEARGVAFLPACGFGGFEGSIPGSIPANRVGEVGGYWLSNNTLWCLKISSSGMSLVSLSDLRVDYNSGSGSSSGGLDPGHNPGISGNNNGLFTYNLCVRLVKDI